MTRPSLSLRRFRSMFPSDSTRGASPAALRRGDDSADATGNSFRARGEKTRQREGRAPPHAAPTLGETRGRFPGRLNVFQKAMLDWRDLHPYNAVHAVRIARALDATRLVDAIDGELSGAGLTGFELDRTRGRYAWRGGPAHVALESLAPGDDWQALLARAFEHHLNAPFPRDGTFAPFRFFVMPVATDFFLAIAYDHFIAGGDSIVTLLNSIADRYAGASGAHGGLRRYPPTHRRLLWRHPLQLARALARLPAMVQSCRRTLRPHYRAIEDGHNGFTFFRLDASEYAELRNATRRWGVTLNDALMALMLLAQDALLPNRDMSKRRHELGVASIVNLRGEHGDDPRATFGQFLSSFRVAHPLPRGLELRELALDVHRATERIKREKLFLTTLCAIAVDRVIGRFRTPEQRMGVYAKSYPVGAGVSSLNINALWRGPDGAPAPFYVRGVPTGPASPIVVAVTTSGDTLCAGVSFRTSAVTPDVIDKIEADIRTRIRALSA